MSAPRRYASDRPTGESAVDRAYAALRAAILDGTHRAGTMLSENALADALGMSRTPVRAALARLQDEGWITIYPKRGALVRGLDAKAVADLAEARLVLEATAVGRADPAVRRTLSEELVYEVDRQRRVLSAGDFAAFVESTVMFHRSFVEVSRNDVMLELYDRLADRQRLVLFTHAESLIERQDHIVQEHLELLDRLRDDPVGFGDSLRVHICEAIGTSLAPLHPGPSRSVG